MSENEAQYQTATPLGSSPVTRICPKCGAQSVTDGNFCPQCGASYIRRRRAPSRRFLIISVAAIVLLLAGVGALVWKHNRDQHETAVAAAASRSAAASSRSAASSSAAASRASVAAASSSAVEAAAASSAAEKRRRDNAERAIRKLEIKEVEKSIKKDAIKDVNDGFLDGPILRVDCTPVGGGSSDNLTAHTGRFSCLAVNKIDKSSGTESGYGFSAVINWDSGEYTWHLGNS